MKLLLIGPPASGKGTIGEKLSKEFHIPLISVGELLRNLSEDNPWKEEIDKLMEAGELAPQDKVAQILKHEASKESAKHGFIFDGWGRELENLQYYDPNFDKVIYLKIPPETSVKRIATRRTCEKCEAVFNLIAVPPKVPGVCDFCGGKLIQREDETEEATRRRLELFNTEAMETIDFYRRNGKLIEIDGEGSPEEVYELVTKALGF